MKTTPYVQQGLIASAICALILAFAPGAAAQERNENESALSREQSSEQHDLPATGAATSMTWSQLSPEQQSLLSGVQAQWDQMPAARQAAMAKGAQRFIEMNERQRDLAKERFVFWNSLTDQERADIRQRFAEFKRLPPEEKERLRQAVRRFQSLTPEQRQRLRSRFQQLTPEERMRARERLRHGQR